MVKHRELSKIVVRNSLEQIWSRGSIDHAGAFSGVLKSAAASCRGVDDDYIIHNVDEGNVPVLSMQINGFMTDTCKIMAGYQCTHTLSNVT